MVFARKPDPKPTVVFDTFFRFAALRQTAYLARLRGDASLSTDPILSAHRFTNCFRASDRVSQYLIRNVVYGGSQEPREVICRTLLFKVFNKISTWEMLRSYFREDSRTRIWEEPVLLALDRARAEGRAIYSAAYVMPSPGNARVKHRAHLTLLDTFMNPDHGEWRKLLAATSLQGLYEVLRGVPSFGGFLAYQFAIDLNYSEVFDYDEDEFVVAGPGARDGIRKCFSDLGDRDDADVIRWVADRQEEEFRRRGLDPVVLRGTEMVHPGRWLHLIDVQNLFCEVDKYARAAHPEACGVSGRMRIKQAYRRDPAPCPEPFFPPKWGLNAEVGGAVGCGE